MAGYCVKAARNGCLRDTPRAIWAAFRMAWGVAHNPLHPVARDYLYRADTVWRGNLLTRLRREVMAALPGTGHAQATAASIRAMTSADGGPASAAATHSASSWRFLTPNTSVSIGNDKA